MRYTRTALAATTALLTLTGLAATANAEDHHEDNGKSNHRCIINVVGNHNHNACENIKYGHNATTGNGHSITNLDSVDSAPCESSPCQYPFTGKTRTFLVPEGVRSINVVVVGAPGASVSNAPGGQGQIITGQLSVNPLEVLYLNVGGTPTTNTVPASNPNPCDTGVACIGGFNGGGGGGYFAAGGGGASDIRNIQNQRLIVAGGGGGAGHASQACPGGFPGGNAGHPTGTAGTSTSCGASATGGGGGTQTAGGTGGTAQQAAGNGQTGRLFLGGRAGLNQAGGGGGGWYGGGGGAAQVPAQGDDPNPGQLGGGAGGGGGSSYYPTGFTAASSTATTGSITLSW
ncbi:glycine-rich protein [Streptomyces sp. NPDC086023]|uniref:glycine-rich protein n=1 Tax=Streptomyces sp. NPDC086023 TaxID=3365746 RepID=UPI0037D157A5